MVLYFTHLGRRSLTTDWHKFRVTCFFMDIIKYAKFYLNLLRGLDFARVEL